MPRTHEMRESKYLKKEDCGEDGVQVTIIGVVEMNVAMEDQAPEMKWCLGVKEFSKPLVLNWTNIQAIERITGSDDTDDWAGKSIVLYEDPNVSFGGKTVGGIRIRAPRKMKPGQVSDSEVPF